MTKLPNILLILADDHGYGDISAHEGPSIQTPNIDRIATNGTRFTRFYANSSVCSPSRASLMTGRYPDRVGVPGVIRTHPENNWGYFRQDATTLPSALKQKDYRTALIGKWHLGLEPENHPGKRGFDHFHGFLGDMMDDYYTHLRHDINYMRHGLIPSTPEDTRQTSSQIGVQRSFGHKRNRPTLFFFISPTTHRTRRSNRLMNGSRAYKNANPIYHHNAQNI